MSNSVIYFGAQPSPGQAVSDSLKEQNINLLKLRPSAVTWSGSPHAIQPYFSIYKATLPTFLHTATTGTRHMTNACPFQSLQYNGPLVPLPLPDIVFSYNFALPDEVAHDLRVKYGAADTVIRGKPAMVVKVNMSNVTEIVKAIKETKPVLTTPAIKDTINLASWPYLRFLVKLVSAFVKMHQYPAFADADHLQEYMKQFDLEDDVTIPTDDAIRTDEEEGENSNTPTPTTHTVTLSNDFNIRLNLPVPFDEKPVCITSDSSTLPPYSGLIFPFVPALAISDESTVMTVIRNYFYGSLADSDEDAVEAFSSLKGAWGIIRNTLAGDVLSHVYKGIEMALHVQSIVTIIAPNDRYAGFLIQGGGFHLTVLDKLYMPVAYEDLKKELYRMDPHLIALSAIMKKLPFPDADSREAYMTTCDTMWKVKQAIDSMGLNEESRNAVATAAKRLSFLEDRPLTIHAANIVHVLDVIRDTSKDLATLPLHHSQLFSSSRAHMAWSAFGDHAPSFRIPGGKAIPVDKPMTRVVRTNSKKGSINETKTVTKIAYQVIPLAMALRHLDETIEKKEILNPFANQVVRVSTDFANKDLTGDSAISVMEALRRLLNVTVVDGPGKGKRKDEDDDAGPSKKKRTAFDD